MRGYKSRNLRTLVSSVCFKVDLRAVKSFFICQSAVNSPCSLKITFITTLSLVEPRQQKFAEILSEDEERYSVIEVDQIKERHYTCHQVVNIWWRRGKEAKYFPPKLLKCGKPRQNFYNRERFQPQWRFMETKERFYLWIKFNSQMTSLLIQRGNRDVKWILFFLFT